MTKTLEGAATLARRAAHLGGPQQLLSEEQVAAFIREQLAAADLAGRSVCVVIPDGTRSCPLPLLLGAVHGALAGRVSRMTALVALGTHAAMDEQRLGAHALSPGNAETLSLPELKELQQLLAKRGFDVGKIDGVIGAQSRDAIRAMQIKFGLPADGYPNAELLDRLRGG